jgi:hypothetical protein
MFAGIPQARQIVTTGCDRPRIVERVNPHVKRVTVITRNALEHLNRLHGAGLLEHFDADAAIGGRLGLGEDAAPVLV